MYIILLWHEQEFEIKFLSTDETLHPKNKKVKKIWNGKRQAQLLGEFPPAFASKIWHSQIPEQHHPKTHTHTHTHKVVWQGVGLSGEVIYMWWRRKEHLTK